MTLLETSDLTAGYDGVRVLRDVSIDIDDSETVAIVGRNGVGKTTLLKSIMGINDTFSGSVQLDGEDVTDLRPYETAKRGIGYIPQSRDIFGSLTVEDNIRLGTANDGESGLRDGIPDGFYDDFPMMREKADQKARNLSGGQKQILAVARAVISNPDLLLLDEPTEGIQPSIIDKINDILGRIQRERGMSLLIVEQNIDFVKSVADYSYVLQKGSVVAAGDTEDVLQEDVISENIAV